MSNGSESQESKLQLWGEFVYEHETTAFTGAIVARMIARGDIKANGGNNDATQTKHTFR